MRIYAFVLATALSLPAALAGTAPPAAPAAEAGKSQIDAWLLQGLLDPATPASAREALGRELLARAAAGDASAQYIAGSLYRQGESHPAQVLPRDLDKARELLLAAALKGSLPAMAKLAQVEYDAGNYAEAMDWTQVFSHYWRESGDFDEDRAHYLKNLLKQIGDKLGPSGDEVVRQRTIALLDRHGATIEAALARQHSETGPRPGLRPAAPRKPAQRLRRAALITDDSGMAEFYIAVDARGRVAKFWVLDAVPGIAMAGQLDGLFRNARFNEDERQRDGLRFGLQTITFSNQKLDLNRR
ncbi:hypothetical protein [Tahibacter harae]|uniref:Uncharacterized protein n=1 Tax=Tahibacter harae TaxID=2963937 RepID=A0ABT1QY36_9GAMM|nr:hypothetical protein [Tahibacter harae]MCQ4167187.1 hypothetical protein [Tahibacter harae]